MLRLVKKYWKNKRLLRLQNIHVDSLSEVNFNIKSSSIVAEYPTRIHRSKCSIISVGEGCHISDSIVEGNVTIGRFVSIMGPGVVIKALDSGVKIGSFTSIGQNVCIYDFNHNIMRPCTMFYNHIILKSDYKYDISRCKNVVIEEDVWIGSNSVITPGVKIGRGAIIGAGSVVTKDIEPYSVAVGNPAVKKFSRFPDDIIMMLEHKKWWEYNSDELKDSKLFFLSEFK